MRTTARYVLLATAVLLCGLCSPSAQERSDEASDLPHSYARIGAMNQPSPDVTLLTPTQLDSLIEYKMAQFDIPGVAALCVKDSQIVWEGYYGYARVEPGPSGDTIEVTDSTIFLMASISKSITATAVMQLWENGTLDKDIHINNYLPFEVLHPSFPDSTITFPMLLAHVSGIGYAYDPQEEWSCDTVVTLAEVMQSW